MASISNRVYVSYSWSVEKETGIVDKLAELHAMRDIEFIRDNDQLKYGELISQFMDNLSSADHVITVFSRKYFESEYCMYELLKIYHRGDFHTRIHPVLADDLVLSDVNIQIEYIEYWKNLVFTTKKKIKNLEATVAIPLTERLKIYEDIYREINKLMSFAGDMKITPLAELEKKNYSPLLDRIKPIEDKGGTGQEQPKLQEDSKFLDELVYEITTTVESSDDLRNSLNKKYGLAEDTEASDLADELIKQCETNINNLIRAIAVITEKLLKRFEKEKAYQNLGHLIDDSEKLVTLLSLFDIPAEKANDLHTLSPNMTLPHEATGSAEVFISRLLQSMPQFRVSKSRPEVVGKHAVVSSDLEAGIKESSIVDDIEQCIWDIVFPTFKGKFDRTRLRDQIRMELHAEDMEKKNYYLVVTLNTKDDEKNPLADEKVQAELSGRLPELPIIVLKNTAATDLYVVSDRDLMARIYDFYDRIGQFQARIQNYA